MGKSSKIIQIIFAFNMLASAYYAGRMYYKVYVTDV
jgi:hypothetical protein